MNEKLIELAGQVENAMGPDRELDLAIKLAIDPDGDIARVVKDRRGFDGKPGMAWDLYANAVCFEKRDERSSCFFNGGYPLLDYTDSIDAALTLIPKGMESELTDLYGVARVAVGLNVNNGPTHGEHVGGSLCLALCAAALRARAVQ